MFEECSNLSECEKRLTEEIQQVKLLGEIPLSNEDVGKLGDFIRDVISPDISKGTQYLKKHALISLSCFLVWKGISGYRGGDYWSAVQESTGLSDPNWQTRWGKIFLNFLQANELPVFEIEGAHSYVAPILAHGGIPNSCLDEFFEEILCPRLHKFDPTDREEIAYELQILREYNTEIKELENQISKLKKQKDEVKRKLQRTKTLNRIKELEEKAGDTEELAELPENPDDFRSSKLKELAQIQEDIQDLEGKKTSFKQKIENFTEQHKQVLTHSEAIERCMKEIEVLEEERQTIAELKAKKSKYKRQLETESVRIFSEKWSEHYGELVNQLSLSKLKEAVENLETLSTKKEKTRERIEALKDQNTSALTFLLSPTLIFFGLVFVGFSFFIFSSTILTFFGISLVGGGGLAGWFRYKRKLKITENRRKAEQTLEEITKEYQHVNSQIEEILTDLPVKKSEKEGPSEELVETLTVLQDTYERWCQNNNKIEEIQKKLDDQIQRIKQTATSGGINVTDSPKQMVKMMGDALRLALKRKQEAEQAEKEIRCEIEPSIEELRDQEQNLQRDLTRIDEMLKSLGKGDLSFGVKQLKERLDAKKQAEVLRSELTVKYPDLKELEREIRQEKKQSKKEAFFERRIRRFEDRLEQIEDNTRQKEEELQLYPSVLPAIDEPIRRFLLYGGEPAEDFFIESVRMANLATEGRIPEVHEIKLPKRIVTAFKKWWSKYQSGEEPISDPTKDRFRAPSIFFNPDFGEIMVHVPEQRYSTTTHSGEVSVEITELPFGTTKTLALRSYTYQEDLLMTEELDALLPFPAKAYKFCLKSDEAVVKSWKISGIDTEKPYMAFQYSSGKLIEDEELPKKKVWIVTKSQASLKPSESIIEGGSVYGKWKGYSYRLLDIQDLDSLCVVTTEGREFPIPISSEKVSEPELFGGEILEAADSEEDTIYHNPPSIRIPFENEAELKVWRISVLPDEESALQASKLYRLSDLLKISKTEENSVEIPLADERLLGSEVFGRFSVRLIGPRQIDERFSFCIVPFLKIEFDRNIYLPSEKESEQKADVTISTAENMEFKPLSSSSFLKTSDNQYKIEIEPTEDAVRGMLHYRSSTGKDCQLSLTIHIPKLRWRLQGLKDDQFSSWCDRVEELWIGNLEAEELLLFVKMPSSIQGKVSLTLSSFQSETEDLHEGKAKFNLLQFSDTLRDGSSLQTFEITILGSESVKNVPLFRVQTRWEVKNIECVQEIEDEMRVLRIQWTEKGVAEHRVVRLWKLWDTDAEAITEQVEDGVYEVTIRKSATELRAGRYRLQIAEEDLWSGDFLSIPPKDAPNTAEIQIEEKIFESVCIEFVIDEDGQIYELDNRYGITIDGKIINRKLPDEVDGDGVFIKPINDGWYVGRISAGISGDISYLDWVNPVKFEYDSEEDYIVTIEDIDGDGPMFCTLCRKIFWSEKNKKRQHKSKIIVPDKFGKIRKEE